MGLAAGEALARAARRMIVLEQLTFGHDRARAQRLHSGRTETGIELAYETTVQHLVAAVTGPRARR